MYRSTSVLSGETRSETRSLLKSMGYSNDEIQGRPMIGIVNSWSTLVPGHYNLRELAQFVEKGIYRAGGRTDMAAGKDRKNRFPAPDGAEHRPN